MLCPYCQHELTVSLYIICVHCEYAMTGLQFAGVLRGQTEEEVDNATKS